MARSTFKTLFYINRSKEKKNGKCPIMGRITIDGEQVQYSTGKETAPELWDSRKGRCKGIGEETKEINRYLQTKEEQAKGKYQELVWQRGYITAELLKRELMEEDKPKGFLLEEARLFIEEKRPCVGITVAKPTFANYIYATQLIEAYLRERLGMEDIRYSQLDYGFIEGLDFYLKSERNLSLATIQIAVIFLRKLIGIGQQKKYIRIDPFADYKTELPHRTRRYLTTEELQRLLQTPIIDKQFERARQLFLFCAFTGLARVDMQRLKPKHIIHNADGTEEIRIKRQKTNVEAIIPLLPIAKQILSLYIKDKKADDLIFPNLTIRKASFACVNIGQICRIEKGLTFHMARHTFSTTICLSNGISMETLSKMLGHSNIGTTQIYGKITDHKIQEDMTALTDREHSAFEGYCKSIARQNVPLHKHKKEVIAKHLLFTIENQTVMKENNKQELSYFRLKLESYMSEHHPERLQDKEFITARADMALTVYCDAVAQGFTHPEAESMASEALYQGLHFSKYDTLISVLENEFERELPAPLPERLALILLSNNAVQATFDKFGLTDTLASDEQYDRLYTELTGTIVLLIESNNLPIIGQIGG